MFKLITGGKDKNSFKSKACEAIHSAASDMLDVGIINQEIMDEFNISCLNTASQEEMNKLVRISNVITDRVNSLLNREPNLTLLFMALYISEGWYDQWFRTGDVHAKARAIVLFDRVITDRHQLRNIPENSED